jgi:hypothetical protein
MLGPSPSWSDYARLRLSRVRRFNLTLPRLHLGVKTKVEQKKKKENDVGKCARYSHEAVDPTSEYAGGGKAGIARDSRSVITDGT